MKGKFKSFIHDGLNVIEAKILVLLTGFMFTLLTALYQAIFVGEITENMLTLLFYLISGITGINIAEIIKGENLKTNTNRKVNHVKSEKKEDDEYLI